VNPSELSEREAQTAERSLRELSLLAEASPAAAASSPSPSSSPTLTPPLSPPRVDSPSGIASWLRLAYAFEFFIALIAIISLWSEVGGEGHLDLMPWYLKLGCIVGLAWCCVRFTAGLVEQRVEQQVEQQNVERQNVERQKVWTRRTLGWFAGILLFCIAMAGITYYYHLHEEQDDQDDDTSSAAVNIQNPGTSYYHAGKTTWRSTPIRDVARSANRPSDRISVRSIGRDPGVRL
jgi:hypothetical protein